MSAAHDPCPASADTPRPEHPRPDFLRADWINLNGPWEFAFDPGNVGEYHGWFRPGSRHFNRRITVPFCWESRLSGLAATEYRGAGWYRRTVEVPPQWSGRRVLLKFGAVDWQARVWLNGRQVGEHEGGYTPFELDVTDHLHPGPNTLVVRAFDITGPDIPTGKQTGWYTHCSGIWQTVWLEAMGAAHFTTVHLTPDVDGSAVGVRAVIDNRGAPGRHFLHLEPAEPDGPRLSRPVDLVRGRNELRLRTGLAAPRLWSPQSPHLYGVTLRLVRDGAELDAVGTYFGMRKVHRAALPGSPREFVHLNNRPVFLAGVLDQSYHPEGVYTYPSEQAILDDLKIAKAAGYDFVRLHIKIDEPRLLYWADRLGLMLMCDIPNFAHFGRMSRITWQETFDAALERDWNHPSIIAWCLFNETWGLQPMQEPQVRFVEQMYHRAKEADPTRLVEDHSPCNYDHVVSDLNSWHFYINEYDRAREHVRHFMSRAYEGSPYNCVEGCVQGVEPVINSEYGGIDAGMGDRDVSWSLKFLTNELRMQPALGGYVYTELQDIEWEHNGVVRYDRSPKEFGYDAWFPGFSVADINGADFAAIDSHPAPRVKPGAPFEADVHFSHWGPAAIAEAVLHWELDALDAAGRTHRIDGGSAGFRPKRWGVIRAGRASVRTPGFNAVGTLKVWVTARGDDGAVRTVARNYINLDVYDGAPPMRDCPDDRSVRLGWDPQAFCAAEWSLGEGTLHRDKVAGMGSGRFAYRLRLPAALDPASLESAALVFEAGAAAGPEKVDARFKDFPWSRRRPSDYPQTDETKFPTDLTVTVNGVPAASLTLPDDPADARGVLSHLHTLDPGSYGFLTRVGITGPALEEIRRAGPGGAITVSFEIPESAANRGGLSLYGRRMGRYPCDPSLELRSRAAVDRAGIEAESGPVAVDVLIEEVPTAEHGPVRWRWTTAAPGDGWFRPDYDDTRWVEGPAGFGRDPGNLPAPQARALRTRWDTDGIWLRREVELPDRPDRVRLRISHDKDAVVYVNGRPVFEGRGYLTDYREARLPPEAVAQFRPGRNVIAVHCRQTEGGQFIDVGLRYSLPRPAMV